MRKCLADHWVKESDMAKKILFCVCIAVLLFIAGMMIRRYYDTHYRPETAGAGQLHIEIKPAESVPTEFTEWARAQAKARQAARLALEEEQKMAGEKTADGLRPPQ